MLEPHTELLFEVVDRQVPVDAQAKVAGSSSATSSSRRPWLTNSSLMLVKPLVRVSAMAASGISKPQMSRSPIRWQWASLKPGRMVRPPRSTIAAAGLANASMAASSPTARMRSPRTARADARGSAASGQQLPPTNTKSAVAGSARVAVAQRCDPVRRATLAQFPHLDQDKNAICRPLLIGPSRGESARLPRPE